METEKITTLINTPQNISFQDVNYLDDILIKHPYFQSGHLLLTKGLLNINSIRYNRQLKRAAAYSFDRKRLFKLITIKKDIQKTKNKCRKEDLKLGSPLEFEHGDNHSFSEWLQLSNLKKVKRIKQTTDESLLANFLKKKTIISRPKKEAFFNPINISKESVIENNDLVTPTLAKVYLEQMHYEKAILAYEKLILKYPKKSSFFAAQIKLINKLNNK